MGSNEFVVSTANFGGDFLRDVTLGVRFRWISCGFVNKWNVFPFSFLSLGRNVWLSLFKAGKFFVSFLCCSSSFTPTFRGVWKRYVQWCNIASCCLDVVKPNKIILLSFEVAGGVQ